MINMFLNVERSDSIEQAQQMVQTIVDQLSKIDGVTKVYKGELFIGVDFVYQDKSYSLFYGCECEWNIARNVYEGIPVQELNEYLTHLNRVARLVCDNLSPFVNCDFDDSEVLISSSDDYALLITMPIFETR